MPATQQQTSRERVENELDALHDEFQEKLEVNEHLDRKLVSYQGDKKEPVYRWYQFREAFSSGLVEYVLRKVGPHSGHVFDPFAGSGTTLFAAANQGLNATGIELLPIGHAIIEARKVLLGGVDEEVREALDRWIDEEPWQGETERSSFPVLTITEGAYPEVTKRSLETYLRRLEREPNRQARVLLRFAALCVLEDVSYTKKAGQFLRWDHRGRDTTSYDKGEILALDDAIRAKLREMAADLRTRNQGVSSLFDAPNQKNGHTGAVGLIKGTLLEKLPSLEADHYDGIITSPPYCNRYDYTRTYALELALLGVDNDAIMDMRQTMLSCTVENRVKEDLQEQFPDSLYQNATAAFENQDVLQRLTEYLYQRREEGALNNRGIPRMVENYFREMALVVFSCARVLKPDAPMVMVNDNVRYDGIVIPVDLLLSDFARAAGFEIERIWTLPRGKGNSSQQMGEHGRREMRKCVYVWRYSRSSSAGKDTYRFSKPALSSIMSTRSTTTYEQHG